MATPLIFFHSGFDPYLAFTIWQARTTNPHEEIWLIGDRGNDLTRLGANHFVATDHASRRDEFVGLYRHFSGHQMENERLCFERWFYLESLLRERQMGNFCFMDSDYFLLEPVSRHVEQWRGYELAGAPVWGFAWFGNAGIVTKFCDYVLDRYRDPSQLEEWDRRFRLGEDFSPPEGIYNVCDMTLWRMFIRAHGTSHLDLSVPREGIVFDSGMSYPGGFRMQGEYKALNQESGAIHGHLETTRERVRFAALHLNGKYPKRIQPLLTGYPSKVIRACFRPNYRRNLRKLLLIIAFSLGRGRKFFQP